MIVVVRACIRHEKEGLADPRPDCVIAHPSSSPTNIISDRDHSMTMIATATRQQRSISKAAFQQLSYRYLSAGPITSAYKKHVTTGNIRQDDDQLSLALRFDHLHDALQSTDARVLPCNELTSADLIWSDVRKRSLEKAKEFAIHRLRQSLQPTPPRGLYIHGSVGVGKSFLMDLFHTVLCQGDTTLQRHHRRAHFHEFMLDVHQRIHRYKQDNPRSDPIPAVALSLAQEARVLCFDEFQVTDIADAMILKRLFDMLIRDAGVVVVATSNRPPETLYEGGINRSLFLPFIDTLKSNLQVVEMVGGHDYRRDGSKSSSSSTASFFWPSEDASARRAVKGILDSLGGGEKLTSEIIPVRMGRVLKVSRAIPDTVAWFDFMDLCHQPLGAADYLALCERYPVLIVDHVPQLDSSRFNEARRFVTLIDALYESKTRLIMASDVPLEHLFIGFDATVETKDGDEEIAVPEVVQVEPAIHGHQSESVVKGEGGSSSSAATTMIRTKNGDVEWSATGRIGVSLAQLSAVRDVSFSFKRAESRLVEMTKNSSWGRR